MLEQVGALGQAGSRQEPQGRQGTGSRAGREQAGAQGWAGSRQQGRHELRVPGWGRQEPWGRQGAGRSPGVVREQVEGQAGSRQELRAPGWSRQELRSGQGAGSGGGREQAGAQILRLEQAGAQGMPRALVVPLELPTPQVLLCAGSALSGFAFPESGGCRQAARTRGGSAPHRGAELPFLCTRAAPCPFRQVQS